MCCFLDIVFNVASMIIYFTLPDSSQTFYGSIPLYRKQMVFVIMNIIKIVLNLATIMLATMIVKYLHQDENQENSAINDAMTSAKIEYDQVIFTKMENESGLYLKNQQ
jgi:hypothetical protein